MATITREFTYKLADDYLAQTGDLNKTAQWTYVGPEEFWIFVETETGKLKNTNIFTKEMNGDVIPTPVDSTKLHISANLLPLLATLLGASEYVDGALLPQYTESLPDGNTYSRPADPMPDHTYDITEATYDFDTNTWNFPWKKTWVTWEDLITTRDRALSEIEPTLRNIGDYPESLQTKLQTYKTALENLETTWAGIAAYKVHLPVHPIKK